MSYMIVVTGASSGLGKAVASYLTQLGHTVIGTSRFPEKYTDLPFKLLPLDVTSQESIANFVELLTSKVEKIDVFINNAGVGITGPVEETSIDEIRINFETNFFGPLALIQAILPVMRKYSSGKIINITSIAAYSGLPFRGVYSASKAALNYITESIRMEVVNFGIQVMTLAPGDYSTDIASRRYHSSVIKDSPYEKIYAENLRTMDDHVDEGGNPMEVAHKIEKMIGLSNPKPHYLIGSFLQKLSVRLKKILPQRVYEKLIKQYYKL